MFTILIVDDNKSDRIGIKGLIDWEHLGIEVVGLAVDGSDGYKQALDLQPDFILTDVAMPVLDGLKMTQKIKAELPETKFIFMSCFDDFDYVKGAVNLEVNGYILKPIDLTELNEALQKVKQLKQFELDKEQNEHNLRRRIQESLPVLQEQLIRDLLTGKFEHEADIQERMNYLGMKCPQECYSVLFLQIDNYEALYADITTEERHFMIYSIQKCVEDTILNEIPGYMTSQTYNSVAIILFVQDTESEEGFNGIVEIANRCKEMVNSKLSLQITIGISDVSDNLKHLSGQFEAAQYAVKSKFYSSGNRIIMASEVIDPVEDFQYNHADIKRKLELLLESSEHADIIAFIEDCYNAKVRYPETYIKIMTYSIIHNIQTILLVRNESFGTVFGSELVVWDKLQRFETLADIKQWLIDILETVCTFVNKAESGRYRKVVDDIKAIIDDKYAEIENVSQIVNSLYISASHANFIFKQQTGQTIFDYLIMKRMEVAKKLLLDPYMKIYEIVEKTGYKRNSYFTSVFKEYTGVTPKQFREKHTV
ncbi:response regulator transcription factor [Cohnella silvisoli]|uniref:Response regulator n=1 Tax=Cohnella silvisoli TaxID=2873699 RepID=A0ABV1KWU7_9BACL|nr:response regulator [Cohnella silvisoli]MCD9023822.1 response regulator [Cohnella silvisoli]